MPSLDHARLADAIRSGRFQWSAHAADRLLRRGLRPDGILAAACEGKRIADYPDDTPYPSALFLGTAHGGESLHVVAAYDGGNDWGYIITAYLPDSSRLGGHPEAQGGRDERR